MSAISSYAQPGWLAEMMSRRDASDVDVAVIGAGLGGLSSAVTLAQAGLRVFVAERHMEPGGYATTFRRGDIRFETCLHLIDGAGPTQPTGQLLQTLGVSERLTFHRPDTLRNERWPHHQLCTPSDIDQYLALLGEHFPKERDGLTQLHELAVATSREYEEYIAKPPMLKHQYIPSSAFLRNQRRSAYECLHELIQDPQLIGILGQISGYYGLPVQQLSALRYLIVWHNYHVYGGYYPQGGSSALTQALCQVFEEHGGTLALRTPVEGIELHRRRAVGIKLRGGETVTARAVISNISPLVTFGELLSPGLLPPRQRKQLDTMALSHSAVKSWFVLDCDPRELRINAPETWWNETYIPDPEGPPERHMVVVSESLLDPSCVPEGQGLLSMLWLSPGWSQTTLATLDRKTYRQQKQAITQRMIERLEATMLPGLSSRIIRTEAATPKTFLRFSGNPEGALFGWRATPQQAGLHRIDMQTAVPGLYMAGAWTRLGSGFSTTMISGKQCAEKVLFDLEQRGRR